MSDTDDFFALPHTREEQVWSNGTTEILFQVGKGGMLDACTNVWRNKLGRWIDPAELRARGWERIR